METKRSLARSLRPERGPAGPGWAGTVSGAVRSRLAPWRQGTWPATLAGGSPCAPSCRGRRQNQEILLVWSGFSRLRADSRVGTRPPPAGCVTLGKLVTCSVPCRYLACKRGFGQWGSSVSGRVCVCPVIASAVLRG